MTSNPFNLETTDLRALILQDNSLKRRKTFDLQLPPQSSLPLAHFSFPGRAPLLALPQSPQGLSYCGCNEKRDSTMENRS